MSPNTNKCEHGWMNFSASFRIVATPSCQTIDLLQYLMCCCSLNDIITSNSFHSVELASTSPSSIYFVNNNSL